MTRKVKSNYRRWSSNPRSESSIEQTIAISRATSHLTGESVKRNRESVEKSSQLIPGSRRNFSERSWAMFSRDNLEIRVTIYSLWHFRWNFRHFIVRPSDKWNERSARLLSAGKGGGETGKGYRGSVNAHSKRGWENAAGSNIVYAKIFYKFWFINRLMCVSRVARTSGILYTGMHY